MLVRAHSISERRRSNFECLCLSDERGLTLDNLDRFAEGQRVFDRACALFHRAGAGRTLVLSRWGASLHGEVLSFLRAGRVLVFGRRCLHWRGVRGRLRSTVFVRLRLQLRRDLLRRNSLAVSCALERRVVHFAELSKLHLHCRCLFVCLRMCLA